MGNPVFSAGGMDFQFVQTFNQVWNTVNNYKKRQGKPGSFWDAQVDPNSGFRPFGTLCVPQTGNPSGTSYMLVARNTSGSNTGPLAPPTGWIQVWNDKNTGNTGGDGACWQMIPPQGYVALGTVFNNNGYNPPNTANYWCIRQDLVMQLGQAAAIWDDRGTGATSANMQCYGVGSMGVPPGSASPGVQTPTGSWALDPGSFLTDNDYTIPGQGSLLNVILLPSVGRLMPSPSSPPPLTPYVDVAPASTQTKVASMDVLFPMISDPYQTLAWQIANPVYTIEIWGQWSYGGSVATEAGTAVLSETIQSGIQTQEAVNWTNQVGVSVSVSNQSEVNLIGAKDKLTLGLTASYNHTWGGSAGKISSTSKTITATGNVPAYTYMVLWQLTYTTYLRRQDGTYVGTVSGTSQLDGYSLAIGTSNYQFATAPYQTPSNPVAIGSQAFPNVYLRMDGQGVTSTATGSGTVNCQSGTPGAWEKFILVQQAGGTFAIQSAQFSNVYLRMDGSSVTQFVPGGGGIVNCQYGPAAYERFNLLPQGDGSVAIESAHFPGVYLRMDGTGMSSFNPNGGGVVNCQVDIAAYEKFMIVPI